MIAAFLDAPLLAQAAFIIGSLVVLGLFLLIVWGLWWPLSPERRCEHCEGRDLTPTVAAMLVWGWMYALPAKRPRDHDHQCECCGDEPRVPPELKECVRE